MLFPDLDDETIFIHRSDPNELLGTFSPHAFKLDEREWLSVEHYFQAMKFEALNTEYQEKIRQASHPKLARKLGRNRLKKLRADWKKVRRVMMTRAVYTKCCAHEEVAMALLNTNNSKLMEGSQYDYYWGCGRDRRAENTYGKVLMDVRNKLQSERKKTE